MRAGRRCVFARWDARETSRKLCPQALPRTPREFTSSLGGDANGAGALRDAPGCDCPPPPSAPLRGPTLSRGLSSPRREMEPQLCSARADPRPGPSFLPLRVPALVVNALCELWRAAPACHPCAVPAERRERETNLHGVGMPAGPTNTSGCLAHGALSRKLLSISISRAATQLTISECLLCARHYAGHRYEMKTDSSSVVWELKQ